MQSPARNPRSSTLRLAVLCSGRGSNLQALIDAQRAGRLAISIELVAGDKALAPALRRAEDAGIATLALAPKSYASRAAFDADLFAHIAQSKPDLIVLAGYMRIVSPDVLAPWAGRIINIHPSLLPKYPGLHTHQRVLDAGDAEHGASVHFVTAELDQGPTLAQATITVSADETPETLATRLLEHEHDLLISCVEMIASGRVTATANGIALDGTPLSAPLRLDADGSLQRIAS